MRGGGNLKAKATKGLAWTSFGLAAFGGVMATLTIVGEWITDIIGFLPTGIAVITLVALVVMIGADLFADGEPNHMALYAVMAVPTVALSVDGKLADKVHAWGDQLTSHTEKSLTSWLGTSSPWVLAACAVAASLLMARRVVTRGGR